MLVRLVTGNDATLITSRRLPQRAKSQNDNRSYSKQPGRWRHRPHGTPQNQSHNCHAVDEQSEYDVAENSFSFSIIQETSHKNEAFVTLKICLHNLPGTHRFTLKVRKRTRCHSALSDIICFLTVWTPRETDVPTASRQRQAC